ncbi:MAG TPA: FtsX-like permease family protein [Pyrinomonadaceae bacterium]|nr:FtsX-like permease family protein [Pyrinomonadaceae bacterium]
MSFLDLLHLSLRNLREAKLRATLTSMGVIVGVAVIVTMVSFGLGLQRNMLSRFRALDFFNEIRVFGKSVFTMAMTNVDPKLRRDENPGDRRGPAFRTNEAPSRILDDAAVAEIQKIPGVAYVEPDISFDVYLRCNGRVAPQSVAAASVPNSSSRFKIFAAGKMLSSTNADEAVIDDAVAETCGFAKPADAIGQTVELLTTRGETGEKKPAEDEANKPDEDSGFSFFGLPIEENNGPPANAISGRTLRIVGVLGHEKREGAAQGGPSGLMMNAAVYVPLPIARDWARKHRNPMREVALALAKQSGQLDDSQSEGYGSAVVRVSDPVALTEVRKRINDMGFRSFSIVDQLDQIRTVFLIIDSVLGLLGGISLLVASFGIANTMIMSILERTREIGIMKAIGAEDREIKLIFFFEAAVIGLTGGIIGCLAAWGIDALANRLAYRFVLKPQGASFVDFFSLPPYLWLGAIAFALVVSILAALYPASRAARIDPVRALRHD